MLRYVSSPKAAKTHVSAVFKNDPLEENNIFENNLTIVNSMEIELQKINPNNDFSFKKLDQLSNDDEQKAKEILKKLGYI